MKKATFLYQLIHSLKKEEKRNFRIYINQGSRPYPKTEQLFDLINNLSAFSPEIWEKELQNLVDPEHISVALTRLQDHLLKSLVQLRSGHTPASQVFHLIAEVDFLQERGFPQLAEKKLRKAQKIAEKYELLTLQYELIQMRDLQMQSQAAPRLEKIAQSYRVAEQILNQIQRRNSLQRLYQQLRTLTTQYGRSPNPQTRERFYQLMDHPDLSDTPPPNEFLANVYFLHTHALFHINLGDWSQASIHYEKLMAMWDSRPQMLSQHTDLYLSIYNNYLVGLFTGPDPEKFQKAANSLLRQPLIPKRFALKQTRIAYSHGLNYQLYFGQQESGRELAKEISEWLVEQSHRLGVARQITLWYNLAVFYFIHTDFSSANACLRHILNLPKGQERTDIRLFTRLFQVLLHWEMSHPDLAESLIRGIQRTLPKSDESNGFQQLCIHNFVKLLKAPPQQSSIQQIFKEWLHQLENIEPALHRRNSTGYWLLRIWLGSKLDKRPLWVQFRREMYVDKQRD